MKNILLFLLFITSFCFGQDVKKVFGKVSDGKNPMENVNVSVLGKENTTVTDAGGNYEIQIETGDKLQFSYTGMRTITIKIEDVTRILNPIMIPDVTELDEVVVQNSKRRSQKDLEEDYPINNDIIRTAYGFIDAKKSPGHVRFLHEEDINSVNLCILDLLRSEFSGVRVNGNCSNGGSINIRGISSVTQPRAAIFDVDGQIFTDSPIWLDVNNFKRIAILSDLGSTARYGNIAAGGVVVINTINGNPQLNRIVDQALLKNNYVKGPILTKGEVIKNMPAYQQELVGSTSLDKAKEVYNAYRSSYANSPYFFIDSYQYFVDAWNAVNYADDIIKENYALFNNNPVYLKALAYTYEEQGRYAMANQTYKDIFILRPNYAQSYLDMATSYRNLNRAKQAASMYARYDYLLKEGFMEVDTVGFGPIMQREYNNLLMLDREVVVKGHKARTLYVAEEDFRGTRLVFEWNDGEAEFDMQFVNPKNQYYTWKHSLFDNPEEIEREKEFGYNVKEYLVDGSLPGTWSVNINYLGNKSLMPTYLKATIYRNYGSASQSKETKVFKLMLKNVNQELFKINVNARNLAK